MITRIWHGRTCAHLAENYLQFLKERAIPDYQSVPGNRGVQILWRTEGSFAYFITITHWESIDAIKAFAGENISTPKYYAEDSSYLTEFEPRVEHYEVHGLM